MNTWSRRAFLAASGAGIVRWALAGESRVVSRRPNVILMVSDDQGSADVGCYGAADLHTPNLDALAARGTRFTSFYVAAPICSPSRGALLTGRYPRRNGLDTNAGGDTGLPESEITLATLFKDAGYHTAVFGKWHLGMKEGMAPTARGFDEFFGHKEGCIDNYSHFFYWSGPNRHDLWRNNEEAHEDGAFFPDLMTREALRFLEEHRGEPFFLYLPYNLPHYPMQARPEFEALYEGMDQPRRRYAAFVSNLDHCVGQVIDRVDALGLRENTLILFLSDNGHSVEERAFQGGGSAGAFRGHKFDLWEGGIRTPCILSWPGAVPEGRVSAQVVSAMDWLPTLAGYCGLESPDIKLDGRNIAETIAHPEQTVDGGELHWMIREHWAVRKGPWKLLANVPGDKPAAGKASGPGMFLVNLDEDPGETINRAVDHPEIVEELSRLHQVWMQDTEG
ncbi:MAG: sulfatase-like hydrolase/transferase [Candidatus Hydrogenedentes bacterium]|nr:sulfatase-like hydrolase/transferase [Candidatus Hydrogenedentota bacterium]